MGKVIPAFRLAIAASMIQGGACHVDTPTSDDHADATATVMDAAEVDADASEAVDAISDTSMDGRSDAPTDGGPPDAGQPVGGPCTIDSDCAMATCLREAVYPPYPGGYCTVRNCDAPDGGGCPAGWS